MVEWHPEVILEHSKKKKLALGNPQQKPKKRFPFPKKYVPGEVTKGTVGQKVVNYALYKLDWKFIHEILDDRLIVNDHLTVEIMETIIGRALLSGYVEEAKDIFYKAKKKTKFKRIAVSDLFWIGQKYFEIRPIKFHGILFINLLRQNNMEAVEFAMENMAQDINLSEMYIMEGEMRCSHWQPIKDVHELTAVEMEMGCMVREIPFISYFEKITPLTTLLLQKKKTDEELDERVRYVIKHGYSPLSTDFQAYKVAATYGMINYINFFFEHSKPQNAKKPQLVAYQKDKNQIYVALMVYAACENEFETMYYVFEYALKNSEKKANDKKKEGKTRLSIGWYIEHAIKKIVSYGTTPICSWRHRLLNGLFNLLTFKQLCDTFLANRGKGTRRLVMNTGLDEEKMQEFRKRPNNNWKKDEFSALVANDMPNYNIAHDAIESKNSDGVGNVLNQFFENERDDESKAGDRRSMRSNSLFSNSSSISRSGRFRSKFLVKPIELFQWLRCTLEMNDYNGEKMALVIFSLGLKDYLQRENSKRKNLKDSDASSTWDMSQAGSVAGDDDNESFFDGGDDDDNDVLQNVKSGRQRRSTLANFTDFFKDMGAKLKKTVGPKDHLSSKHRVIIIEAASEFGSAAVLDELLQLIAPEIDFFMLKCTYLAVTGKKIQTARLLLQGIANDATRVLAPDQDGNNYGLRGGRKKGTLKTMTNAFREYASGEEGIDRLKRQRDQQDSTARSARIAQSGEKRRKSLRKSLRNSLHEGKKWVTRRFSRSATASTKSRKSSNSRGGLKLRLGKRNGRKNKQKETGIKKNKGTSTKSDKLKQSVLNKKAPPTKSSNPKEDFEQLLTSFLSSLFQSACNYESFQCAEEVVNNRFADKIECCDIVVNLLRNDVGPKPKRVKDSVHHMQALASLLMKTNLKRETGLLQVIDQLIDCVDKEGAKTVANFNFFITRLTLLNGRKFLTLSTMKKALQASIKPETKMKHWLELIKAIVDNLSLDEADQIGNINQEIGRKVRSVLSPEIRAYLNNLIADDELDSTKLKVESGKGGKRKKGRFSVSRRSLGRLGGSFMNKRRI